ncbi:ABC transporter ATP-binding protein [Novosphingobium sp. H3SJ31-1]|uniref:ABC transporter ATP-binding protein n=1 Tax=Novosphingobium album (ex Liu et al. 2023) TaxID=3031130 RepID=A0ABT5WTH4_9SPHN|nr:ABC transporter ATP-binding protein [Novosphingobium album (ex Liu et al. 2023)]
MRNGLSVIGPDKPLLAIALALAVVLGLLETLLLYIVAAVAIAMSSGGLLVRLGPHAHAIEMPMDRACQLGLAAVGGLIVISFPLAKLMAALSWRAMIRLRTRILEAYLGASLQYRDSLREGSLQQLIGDYCLRAENVVQQLTLALVNLVMFVIIVAGAIVSSPEVALLLIASLAICTVLLSPVGRWLREDATKPTLTNREIVSRVAQAARVSTEIAAYHVERPVADMLNADIRSAARAMGRLRFEGRLVPNLFQYGTIGFVLILVSIVASIEPSYLAGLAPLALLLVRALASLRQVQRATHVAREIAPFVQAIEADLDALETHSWPAGEIDIDRFDTLGVRNLCYQYGAEETVLKGLHFVIRPGEVIGIVGPSGGGKSTLSALLLRLRLPTAGQVLVGDVPLEAVSAQSWSRLSAFVPQDSKLVFGTVRANIRFFRPGFSDDDVEAAARAAHIHDEIMRLPQGYDTQLGPGSRDLSGGQRQRLSIARALLGKPELIVMDEPTSALDSRSEKLVTQTLQELRGRTTIVLIAHRPTTLEVCDRIFEMDAGVLTERLAC